jgi:hypothetical protein
MYFDKKQAKFSQNASQCGEGSRKKKSRESASETNFGKEKPKIDKI